MYQGFYDLTSGMITQRRNLNTISNNMVNIQTAGYKKDTMVSTTFKEEMMVRTGNYNKNHPKDIAMASRIKSAARTYTDHEQGSYETTDGIYDVALGGKGYFAISTPRGTMYTRGGAFSVDENGVLELAGVGRVQSVDGRDIVLPNDNFAIDPDGSIYDPQSTGEQRTVYGTLKVFNFMHKENVRALTSAIEALQEKERLVISLYYVEELNMNQIAEVMEISQPRVSQLHSIAIRKLRKYMDEHGEG